MEAKVKDMLELIRAALQRDGGDIELVDITDDNVVLVRLKGHCAGCPGAMMTLKGLVERVIREEIPEVKAVEAVPFE